MKRGILTLAISSLIIVTMIISCDSEKKNNRLSSVISDRFIQLDSVLNSYSDSLQISGGVGLVYAQGEIVYHNSFGYRDIERTINQKTDDIFRIASMTKPVTSVAAMMLYEEGKFNLDDPVSKYIPEFAEFEILDRINYNDSTFQSHPAKEEMLIKHLFTHSSGLYYAYDNDTLAVLFAKNSISEGFEERDILLKDNVRRLAELPLLHEPGERFTYGLSIDVLGRLVEIWSGVPLDEFFEERLFKPLGMNDSYFYLPESKHSRLTPVYMSAESGYEITDYPLVNYPVSGAGRFLSGGGDMSCTAYDYYLFCRMMIQNGELNGVRILKPETVDLICSTHLERGDNDMGLGIGLLSAKTYSNQARSVGSYSWGGFFTTTFWIDPAKDVIAVLMLQMYPFSHWQIQKDFENTIYSIITPNN